MLCLLKDYFKSESPNLDWALKDMSFDFLLETSNVMQVLFDDTADKPLEPAGMRILGKTIFNNRIPPYCSAIPPTFAKLTTVKVSILQD